MYINDTADMLEIRDHITKANRCVDDANRRIVDVKAELTLASVQLAIGHLLAAEATLKKHAA